MMTPVFLHSLSVGYLAASRLATAKNGTWRNHSAFRHTLNVQLDDGSLLPLISAHSSRNHPDAIRVKVPENWDWRNSSDVQFDCGVLIAREWQTALPGIPVWQPVKTAEPQLTPQVLRFLETQLRLWCQQKSIDSVLKLLPDDAFGVQVEIAPDDSDDQLIAMANRIIGFGGGLTPDGDDYLLGYFAALGLTEQPSFIRHRQQLTVAITPRLMRTNDISRHYLHRAVQGHFSESLCRLMAQLCAPFCTQALGECATDVMSFGAASGADCMAGFLHGLRNITRH